jgi:hypothetical protein
MSQNLSLNAQISDSVSLPIYEPESKTPKEL